MEQQKHKGKRIGRPLKIAVLGKRYSLGLKVTGDIKRRLDQEARSSGRTQSQEAEYRLERSFWLDDMLKARVISMRVPAASPPSPAPVHEG